MRNSPALIGRRGRPVALNEGAGGWGPFRQFEQAMSAMARYELQLGIRYAQQSPRAASARTRYQMPFMRSRSGPYVVNGVTLSRS